MEAAANRDSAVSVRGLHVTRGGVEILRGIDLEIRSGTIYGLLGPSGAGKTTLMRSIMGLQRRDGEIQVLGRPAGSKPVRGCVGYMAQAGAVYSDLSVIENLRFFGRVFGVGADRAREVMAAMRLEQYEHRQVWHLSGGEQRRVSLGCAIVGEPELMVLDEPTVGLDPALRVEFWETFGRWADRGQTLIVSSHVMDEAERCDRLVLMRDGAVLDEGTPAELLERTGTRKMEDAFLKLEGEAAPVSIAMTAAVVRRTAMQLRNDPRTIALLLAVPLALQLLTNAMYESQPETYDRIAPLLMGLFPFTMMFLVTSIAVLRERTGGTLERLMASPLGKGDLIAGYAVSFSAIALLQVALVATLVFGVLDVPNHGSLPLAAAMTMFEAVLGIAIGLLVSAFARTEFQAIQFFPVVALPQFLLAGLLVPVSQLPSGLEAVADLMPLKYAFDGLQRITQQGQGLSTGAVAGDFAFVIASAIAAIALGAMTLRRTAT